MQQLRIGTAKRWKSDLASLGSIIYLKGDNRMDTLVQTTARSGVDTTLTASSEPSILCRASMRLFGGAITKDLPNTPANTAALRLLVKIAKGEGELINGQLQSVRADLGVPAGTDKRLLKMLQESLGLNQGDPLEALQQFQQGRGLRSDKILGESTAQHLLKALADKNMIELRWVGCYSNS